MPTDTLAFAPKIKNSRNNQHQFKLDELVQSQR